MKSASVFLGPERQPPRIVQWMLGKNEHGIVDYRHLLLPTLAWQTRHNNQRWITWIASQFIEKESLDEYGVDRSCLRMIVDSSTPYSSFKLLLTALSNQRSAMVIASLPDLTEQQSKELERAATIGNCQAILLIH